MFDLAWSEIGLIAVVALIVIGPKDLPDAIRGVAKGIQKLRRMAGEFQGHVDEMVREAKLDEVRDQINQIRNFDLKGEIEKAVDQDGTIRKTFTEDPFSGGGTATPGAPSPAWAAPGSAAAGTAAPGESGGSAPQPVVTPAHSFADTFGPPTAAPDGVDATPPLPEAERRSAPEPPPAFLPPEALRAAEVAKAEASFASSAQPPHPAPAPTGTTSS